MLLFKEILFYVVNKLPAIIVGTLQGNLIYAYFGKHPNFGDQLTPLLLRYYGFTPCYANYRPRWKFSKRAEVVSAGTLLQDTPEDFDGIIIGTGCDDVVRNFKKANVLGVRGLLTKKNLGLQSNKVVIGDPGLLMPYIFPKPLKKKWIMGVVPHFVDKGHPLMNKWEEMFGNDVCFIDVQNRPATVIEQIKMCENIAASSLHGLITADAFGIPSARFAIRDTISVEMDHKYYDYYTGLGIEMKTIEVTGRESLDYVLSNMTNKEKFTLEMRVSLDEMFKELKTNR